MAKKTIDIYKLKANNSLQENNLYKEPSKINMKEPKNVHAGHRERLRNRFLANSLETFEEHEMLELLLFYSIPVKDTNEIAHRLIHRFGSLSDVFDADYNELCAVQGVGERTATLIKMMPELYRMYEKSKLNDKDVCLNSPQLISEYMSKYFKGLTVERLYVLCLDASGKKISVELISEGTVKSTIMNSRKITETVIRANAANVILLHNHPSGIAAPSSRDVDATMGIVSAMKAVGIKITDHIIIGNGDDFFSFRASPKWKRIF